MKKDRCSFFPFCWRKVWRYLQMSAGDVVEHIPYCEKHAKIADEMFKNDEFDFDYKGEINYERIEDE